MNVLLFQMWKTGLLRSSSAENVRHENQATDPTNSKGGSVENGVILQINKVMFPEVA